LKATRLKLLNKRILYAKRERTLMQIALPQVKLLDKKMLKKTTTKATTAEIRLALICI
jgi:hypothetical protein